VNWQSQLRGDPLPWLLETESPGARYLALRDVVGLTKNDRELRKARKAAHRQGPIAAILDAMDEDGYWAKPGAGYGPKYRSTVWSLIMLAQLGASMEEDKRIARACDYLIDNSLLSGGRFSANRLPSGIIDCLQGNLCRALLALGYDARRLAAATEWMARSVTGEGIAPATDKKADIRYYAGKCGPDFACGANNRLPCAWGAVKVMLAFGSLPEKQRTPLIQRAITRGVDFLFSTDPATADYPHGYASKPSGDWWKFGFPVFYITDLLQLAEALSELGYGNDPRLSGVLDIILEKQDCEGRWPLEFTYTGKTWVNFGPIKRPNKWVTLRALRVLKLAGD
jgi:hypothetical protein